MGILPLSINKTGEFSDDDSVFFDNSLSKKNNKKRERNYTNKKENEQDDDNKIEDKENDDKDDDESSNNDNGYVSNVNYEDDEDDSDNDNDVDNGDDDGNDDGDCDEDDDIDEVKIQLVIMNNNIKTPIAKILTIQPASYKNVIKKINLATRKILGREIKSMDNYTISYKAVNARGPSNTLEDKLDFQEFISKYQKITSSGKRMLVTATVRSNVIEEKNRKNKKNSDDKSRSSSKEEQAKKKKKSRPTREDDLSKEEKAQSEIIADLVEILQLWARDIVCIYYFCEFK
ncbi:hypothetical protein C1645_823444 [Glomus cerebriforme]|uniref:Uncharacterized protein n=1 Tax=Glomus cerebriforme TaxID=658196 RepID=A0A397SWL9_9GLOM|nr:hypothetical protein C1645_823444 [Glomus cerebriforme]